MNKSKQQYEHQIDVWKLTIYFNGKQTQIDSKKCKICWIFWLNNAWFGNKLTKQWLALADRWFYIPSALPRWEGQQRRAGLPVQKVPLHLIKYARVSVTMLINILTSIKSCSSWGKLFRKNFAHLYPCKYLATWPLYSRKNTGKQGLAKD